MLYQRRSFTVPATASNPSLCVEKGHSAKDSRGRCMNCGEKVGPSIAETNFAFHTRAFGWHESKQFPGFDERDVGDTIREYQPSPTTHDTPIVSETGD